MQNNKLIILVAAVAVCAVLLALSGCDNQAQPAPKTPPVPAAPAVQGSPSLLDGMASSAASGFGMGAGAAVGHGAVSHGIESFKKRRRATRIYKSRGRRR